MPAMRKRKKNIEAILHVIGYEEKNRCIAHCLDFDLVAEGATHKEARDNLADLIFSYLRFAMEKDIEQFAYHPAPNLYWDVFKQIHKKGITAPQSITPALLKARKGQIKDLIPEVETSEVPTHA